MSIKLYKDNFCAMKNYGNENEFMDLVFAKRNLFALQKNTKISRSFDEEQDHTKTINSIAYA